LTLNNPDRQNGSYFALFYQIWQLWGPLLFATKCRKILFLVNVNSCSCSLYVVVRPSVVCNVRTPYSADWNFRQCFFSIGWCPDDIQELLVGQR